jgi:hypothetical protein
MNDFSSLKEIVTTLVQIKDYIDTNNDQIVSELKKVPTSNDYCNNLSDLSFHLESLSETIEITVLGIRTSVEESHGARLGEFIEEISKRKNLLEIEFASFSDTEKGKYNTLHKRTTDVIAELASLKEIKKLLGCYIKQSYSHHSSAEKVTEYIIKTLPIIGTLVGLCLGVTSLFNYFTYTPQIDILDEYYICVLESEDEQLIFNLADSLKMLSRLSLKEMTEDSSNVYCNFGIDQIEVCQSDKKENLTILSIDPTLGQGEASEAVNVLQIIKARIAILKNNATSSSKLREVALNLEKYFQKSRVDYFSSSEYEKTHKIRPEHKE